MKKIFLLVTALTIILPVLAENRNADNYLKVLKNESREPVDFILEKLADHDLIIFDDALHPALETFIFYSELVNESQGGIDYVFVEIFSIDAQPYLDAYFQNSAKDSMLLLKVFQNDFSGYGYRYQTYLDLLSDIWDYNAEKSEFEKIKVIGVNQPVYWEGIHTRQDYMLFVKSLAARDYFMYKMIVEQMQNFVAGKKGIFLTNTRHAYKNIKNRDDNPYWNTGTFFYHWHSGKTYSVRIHNVMLFIEKATEAKRTTAQGMEAFSYKWIRMENGLWDEAFRQNDNKPAAFSLRDNAFGKADYIGNHMLNVRPGQTMYDAYDALIFLKPLEELHICGMTGYIYTPEFKKELKRRIQILEEDNIEVFLQKRNVTTIEEFINKYFVKTETTKNNMIVD